MRLFEVEMNLEAPEPGEQLSQDPESRQRIKLNPKEMQFILDLVKDEQLTYSELKDKVNDALVDYSRNKNSLKLAAPRMYAIVHGELPIDMVDNAGWFSTIPNTMIQYAEAQGYEANDNLRRAAINAKHRKKKITSKEAIEIMLSYFQDHEAVLDKKQVVKNRPSILRQIEAGQHVDVIFDPFFITEAVLGRLYKRLVECRRAVRLDEALKLDDEIGKMLAVALKRYEAARMGLGIVGRLKDPEQKTKHRSRIMTNLNALRGLVGRVEKMLPR